MQPVHSLTALRGFAAIWIVLHHFWPQTAAPVPYLIAKGYLAVDLFFILSGVVLYLVYADQIRAGRFDMKHFAFKRFARLYPVHFLTLILAALILNIGPALGFEGRALQEDQGRMFLLHLTLLHAWGLTQTGGFNYPSWSLAAEAFAYLLFPFLTFLTLKCRHALGMSLLFFLLMVILVQIFWPASLRNPHDSMVFTRLENDFGVVRILPEFLLGLAIAKYAQTGAYHRSIFIIAVFFPVLGLWIDLDILVVSGFAALLASCLLANPETPRPLIRLGDLSYSIYMCHALVQIAGFKVIERLYQYHDSEVPVLFLLPLLAVTLICAIALHYGCERPARRWLLLLSPSKSAAPKAVRSCST